MSEEMSEDIKRLESLRNQLIGNYADRECREVMIDYLLEKHSTGTDKPNSILQIEGKIKYYEEVRRSYYDALSETSYLLNYNRDVDLGSMDQTDFQPDGQGSEIYHLEVQREKRANNHQNRLNNNGQRIKDLISLCGDRINELEEQLKREEEQLRRERE
jgi:hypothetical protein